MMARVARERQNQRKRVSKQQDKRNIVHRLYEVLLKQGKNTLEHLGEKFFVRNQKGKNQLDFDQMLDLFQEDFRKQQPETHQKNHIADIFNFKASEYKMQQSETDANKKTSSIIKNLVQKRIEYKDNTFLVMTEMDSFEK